MSLSSYFQSPKVAISYESTKSFYSKGIIF